MAVETNKIHSKKFMPAKSDVIFKLLFGNDLNKDILVKFLSAVLKLPLDEYNEIKINDPHNKRKYKDDKLTILDIKLSTATGKIINIEIQLQVSLEMRERIVFYNSRMMAEQLGSGDSYDSIKKTISIVIAGDELLPEHNSYHDTFTLYSPITKTEFTDIIEIHTLELSKLPSIADGTDLFNWLEFINANNEEELAMIAERNPIMQTPVDKLLELNHDAYAREIFEAREKQRRDTESIRASAVKKATEDGIKQGVQQGIKQGVQRGINLGATRLLELIQAGLTPEDAMAKIENENSNN